MPRKETSANISAQAQQDLVQEGMEMYELPKSLVQKLAKSAISSNAKLQKEAMLSLLKSSTVFINYLAATAHDVATSKQHKSISASDVLRALELIELGDMVAGLQRELQIYRDIAKAEKTRKGPSAPSRSRNISSASTAKGKEKASAAEPQRAPREHTPPAVRRARKASSASNAPPVAPAEEAVEPMQDEPEDEGGDLEDEPALDVEDDLVDDVDDEPEDEDIPEAESDEQDEQDGLEDRMAVEDAETHADARALGGTGAGHGNDDMNEREPHS